MYNHMDYVLRKFYDKTKWDEDNLYANICATPQALLDFEPPSGFRLNVLGLATPWVSSSYSLCNLGSVSGSISYLYSTCPLNNLEGSKTTPLHDFIPGYRLMKPLVRPEPPWAWEVWYRGRRVDTRDSLYYGRLFLPRNQLEAMYVRRYSPTSQFVLSCVSDKQLKNGGTITTQFQNNHGRYSNEFIYSTDGALLGFRGLYNFAAELVDPFASDSSAHDNKPRLSAGGEVYYGLFNKTIGVSTSLRYTALSAYTGTPLTMTLSINPLMGHLSSTYSLRASPASSFTSRFDFNVYSYESDLNIGCEIWRKNDSLQQDATLPSNSQISDSEPYKSAIKASFSTSTLGVRLLWEGRFKDFLFSAGTKLDLSSAAPQCKVFGIEFIYSS